MPGNNRCRSIDRLNTRGQMHQRSADRSGDLREWTRRHCSAESGERLAILSCVALSRVVVGHAMKITRRQFLHVAAAASAAVPSAMRFSHAAEWRPNGAMRILVPAAPGGATDIMGRILAQHLEVSSWFGVFLPGGTPAPVVNALNTEIRNLLEAPNIIARIGELGARPDYGTPTQFATFVSDEIEKFGAIIRKENLQMDVN
jgi:hypothetical protein